MGLPNVARWESAARVIYEKAARIRASTEPGCGQGRRSGATPRRPALVRESCASSNPQSSHRAESPRPAGFGNCGPRHYYRLRWPPATAVASGNDQSASIIAPGRKGSQLPAQTHQGPPELLGHAGLGTTTARREPPRQYLPVMTLNASIIAPGREGSQLGQPPKLVSTQTANGGGEGQPLAA